VKPAIVLAIVLAVAGAIAAGGWYVSSLRLEITRLERDLQAERALRATENAAREKQARRAIETARRQEREQRDQWERAYVEMQGDRDRLAADLSGAIIRLRNVRATAPRAAACGDRVPEAAATAADAGDPIGLFVAYGERLFGIAGEADAAAVQARIERVWIRSVTDVRLITAP
jgi:hypothetical protein